jgi:hypothetical protein
VRPKQHNSIFTGLSNNFTIRHLLYVVVSCCGLLPKRRKIGARFLGIEVSGTVTSLAEALALTAALKPAVLLMDQHMQDEREYTPELAKPQIVLRTKCIVAISFWNDHDAKALAASFGAHVLVEKMNLYSGSSPR